MVRIFHIGARALTLIAAAAAALWLLAALLVSLTPVSDPDLGFHISWGRLLLDDFGRARSLTLGQHPSIVVYAYSYWIYQVVAATLFDHAGPWSLVILREMMVLGALALAFLLAGRLGAPLWARATLLAFGVLVGQERFVDRPDVFSTLAWTAALWILIVHRRGRGVWALVPLQILWVNTHLFFSLLPLGAAAFFAGDFLDGSSRNPRRTGLVLGALVLASFVGPAGPGAWASQLKLAGFASGREAPVQIEELLSPFANYKNLLSVWAFRIGMPICVIAAIAGRKRVGTGAVLALLVPAAFSILARRTMALFALTAVALAPSALEFLVSCLPAAAARSLRLASVGVGLVAALVGVVGLANGRVLLAEDKPLRIGDIGRVELAGMDAARFLRDSDVQGPVFHNPVLAGAILLHNGERLTPFMDARWVGTDEAVAVYRKLTRSDDASAAAAWDETQRAHGFETVMLDFYEMPALLRRLSEDPGWALVFVDDDAAVFCRRGGPNDRVIAERSPEIAAARALADPDREAALGGEVVRFLGSRHPSPLVHLDFPWESFRRGNFALQVRDRPAAQVAYLDLFRRQRGSLHLSPHRVDVLRNALWCLAESGQWEAQAALCSALVVEEKSNPGRRIGLRVGETQALLKLGLTTEIERSALGIVRDPAAEANDRWWAWTCIASARETAGESAGAADALRAASRIRPDDAETFQSLGTILDTRLGRAADALEAYEKYLSLGGRSPAVEERVRQIRQERPGPLP
jgi:tetratricopeptide (TPR) repeat protein